MRNRGYRLTLPMVKLYYNVLGIDDTEVDFESIELDVDMIEDISPTKKFNLTDMFSYQLDDNMILLLEKMCGLKYKLSKEKQEEYFSAINIILKAVTNLNLIENDSNNFVLQYKRISYLLIVVLSELITFQVDDTIELSKAINKRSYSEIEKYINLKPNTSLLLLLSLNPNDIKDYKIFDEYECVTGHYEFKNGEVNLKLGEVIKLLEQNRWETSDIIFDETEFKRLSLKKSCEMTE